ncbi:DUF2804 domain-containing protein [Paraferrimonas sp. SM1919]|uniref:DUF2804 domain-containing protein n=1 Tax=Paraferrimonas sp. SM1919 TaxID=2662263 RepID=UPI0013D42CB5|nr:DUF2804 domain-containing protein [Paraferrimonas sp. SM1919]
MPHLIQRHGLPKFGHFDDFVSEINLSEAQLFNTMDKPCGSLKKQIAFKQFQFVCIKLDSGILGVAIANIGFLSKGFCYFYDSQTNELLEQEFIKPFGKRQTSPSNSTNAIAGIQIDISHGKWTIKLNLKHIQAQIELIADNTNIPMVLCSPTGYNGWTYTQKQHLLKPVGQLSINGQPQSLEHALASTDFSSGFMRRETSWRWASLNIKTKQAAIGFNLAAGVNETGYTENALWINGNKHLLAGVQFEFDRHDTTKCWRITTANKQIDLTFTPSNHRKDKLNLIVLKSNFRQFMGHFSGTVTDNDGNSYQIEQALGLTEDHYAKW